MPFRKSLSHRRINPTDRIPHAQPSVYALPISVNFNKPFSKQWARFSALLILAAVINMTLLLSTTHAEEPITIRFSHAVANKTPKGQMAIKFRDLVAQRLPGRVKVKIYPRSLMYQDSNVGAAIAEGKVELAAPALSKLRQFTPKLQLFDLPFLFPNMEAVERFQNSMEGQALLYSMEQRGIVGLGYLHNGMKQLSGNYPIRTPTDIAGKTYRIMTSDVLKAQFEAVNATPVAKPFSQVYNLLVTGTIDGQENTWSNIYASHFYRAQSHIAETNHGLLDYMVITSPSFWNKLPVDVRETLEDCIRLAIAHGNQIAARQNQQNRTAILGSGMTKVVELTQSDREQWVNAMKPVWGRFSADIGEELIRAALVAGQGR
tara:strand:+ start:206 stop:1330 length:1125 start_codon:yes stop_codon:yes gene_type:complete